MIRNYVTTTLRNLVRSKLYSFINIGGLAVGLAAVILISLFIRDELSFDKWLPDLENVHRLEMSIYLPAREPLEYAVSSGPIRDALLKEFPNEIVDAVRLYRDGGVFSTGERFFSDSIAMVDPGFFDIFDLEMVEGDRQAALSDNASVILSESVAKKYFGDASPLGQTLSLNDESDFVVTGVFRDLPHNTHLTLNMIALFDTSRYENQPWVADDWDSPNLYTYLKFRDGTDIRRLLARFPDFVDRNAPENQFGIEDAKGSQFIELHLLPVLDIHLHSTRPFGINPPGSITTVYTFAAVAFFILLIASVNFVNLATARATTRAREVSMRKVLGAQRQQLIAQFLGESVILAAISLVLAVAIAEIALPYYNEFLQKEVAIEYFNDVGFLFFLIGLPLIVGGVSGFYPAIYLSSFRPAGLLGAQAPSGKASSGIKNALVTLQFAISIALIVATAVVHGQILFARNLELGFDRDNKIILSGLGAEELEETQKTLEREVEKLPGVRSAVLADHVLPRRNNWRWEVRVPSSGSDEPVLIDAMSVDFGYFELYKLDPVSGRTLQEKYARDKIDTGSDHEEITDTVFENNIVINESAVRKFGFGDPQSALGQYISSTFGDNNERRLTVVGVVPDVHTHSIHFDVPPVMFVNTGTSFSFLVVDLVPGDVSRTLDAIDELWKSLVPGRPIARSFVDEDLDAFYQQEDRYALVFSVFAILAVLISCLGLFGVASFAAERSIKGIGVRKILGATVVDIVRLLTWQFSKPVLLANVIAWPVAWYFMRGWLDGFAYRIDLSIFYFLGAGALALFIAWATVTAHAIRVARANPVHALRYE